MPRFFERGGVAEGRRRTAYLRRGPSWVCAWAIALGVPSTPQASADEPTAPTRKLQEAEALANRAYELFQQGDYAEAILLFEQAETLSHSPVILSFIAQAQEALGHLVEARATYERIIEESLDDDAPPDFVHAQRRARRQAPLLERRIPRVKIAVVGADPADVEVQLDGRVIPGGLGAAALPIDPGNRTLILRTPGRPPVVRGFVAAERTVSELEIVFTEEAPTTPSAGPKAPPEASYAWLGPAIAYGIGGAGLVLGTTAGVVHLTRASALVDRCPDDLCPPELEPERETLRTLGIVSGIGFAFAGAGLVTGTAFLLAPAADPAVSWTVGPGSFTIRGRF